MIFVLLVQSKMGLFFILLQLRYTVFEKNIFFFSNKNSKISNHSRLYIIFIILYLQ